MQCFKQNLDNDQVRLAFHFLLPGSAMDFSAVKAWDRLDGVCYLKCQKAGKSRHPLLACSNLSPPLSAALRRGKVGSLVVMRFKLLG